MGCAGAKDLHCMSEQEKKNLELARLVCRKSAKDALPIDTSYKTLKNENCPAEAHSGRALNRRRRPGSSCGTPRCSAEDRLKRPRRSAVKSVPLQRLPAPPGKQSQYREDWCEVKARLSCLAEPRQPCPASPCVSTISDP